MEFKDFYSLEEKFTSAQGMSLAFAIVTGDHFYNNQREPLDESYGYFSASSSEWSFDQTQGF